MNSERADLAIVRRPAPAVTAKKRRDYTARELEEMATNARDGIPPAGSVADGQIRDAEMRGDYTLSLALREEVKERAPDLARMARAQRKAERRAANRAGREASS
jgi:hypothetical protein